MINRNALNDDERDEFDRAIGKAWGAGKDRTARIDAFEALLLEAEERELRWPVLVRKSVHDEGMWRFLDHWHNKAEDPLHVTRNGKQKPVRRTVGTKTQGTAGVHWIQGDLADASFESIRDRTRLLAAQVEGVRDELAAAYRALLLADRCPDAVTPREACESLDLDFDAFMADEAAA